MFPRLLKVLFLLISIFQFLILQPSYGQTTNNSDLSKRVLVKQLTKNDLSQNRSINFEFTAVLIKSNTSIDFAKYAYVFKGDTLIFTEDLHAPTEGTQSNLLQFNDLQNTYEIIYFGKSNPDVEIIFINGFDAEAKPKSSNAPQSNQITNCGELTTIIQQSDWRAGLQAPSYNRSFTTVENIIVHHSAGLNTVTNYRQAVRGVYILHTEVNGWSDIGYNYLVAPDGSIFAGRDPLNGDQDRVIGAHFCGSNSGTMGICLLGNYEEVDPTDTLIGSLEKLLSWKINKEDQLSALGINSHPLNNMLNQIAGHRDGCSTLCPGENVYQKLQQIRIEVDEIVANCDPTDPDPTDPDPTDPDPVDPDPVDPEPSEPVVDLDITKDDLNFKNFVVYPNPVSKEKIVYCYLSKDKMAQLSSVFIVDALGKKVEFQQGTAGSNTLRFILSNRVDAGIYQIQFVVDQELIIRKIVVP